MSKTSLLLPLLLAGLTGLTGFVGACGGEPSAGTGGAGEGPATERVADDKAELAFAKCMREKGFNISDPDGSGRTRLQIDSGPGDGMTPQKVQKSTQECRKKTGGGPREPTAAEQTEMRDRALKFAKCMREQGVDMPDPKFEGGGIQMTRKAGERGIDPASPVFQKAQQACEDVLPRMRGGDGGPSTDTSGGGSTSGSAAGATSDAVVPAP